MVNIQRIKAYIAAGEASSAPPLGPLLGQYQVNISDFVPKFNSQSLDMYEKGVFLSVNVFRNPKDKTYKIVINGPTTMGLINSVTKLGIEKSECLTIAQLFDVILVKQKSMLKKLPIESVASSILSSLSSTKIAIKLSKNEIKKLL
jgi:ribosomal protein L11